MVNSTAFYPGTCVPAGYNLLRVAPGFRWYHGTVRSAPGRFVNSAFRILLVAVGLLPLASVSAQIYKWVDEHGVTNYSNHRPAQAVKGDRIGIVKNRISVYSPDPHLSQAVDEFRMRSNTIGANNAASPAAPPQQFSAPVYVPAPVAPDPCGGDCTGFYEGYYPYAPGFGRYGYRHWRKRIPQVRIKPGTIAGQVVGRDGYIAGNSANAQRYGRGSVHRPFRPAFEPSSTGGRRGRPVQLPSRYR